MIALLTTQGMVAVLEELRSTMIREHLDIFMDGAALLAALLAAWAFIKISHEYIEGQGITFWMFSRPLVLLLLVCNFNMFVLSPVHSLTTMFTHELATKIEGNIGGFWQNVGHILIERSEDPFNKAKAQMNDAKEMGDEEMQNENGFWPMLKRMGAAIAAAASHVTLSIHEASKVGVATSLFGIANVLAHIIYYCQVCCCYIFLIMYGILGPFVFAFSIVSSYSRGIADWFARYVQTAFWIPVGQLVFLIGSFFLKNITALTRGDLGILGNAGVLSGLLGNFNIGSWMGIIMICAVMMAILSVPKICSYIIDSAGTGGVVSSIGHHAKSAGHRAKELGKLIIK